MPTNPGPRRFLPADDTGTLRVQVSTEVPEDTVLLAQWDDLACRAGAPRSAPDCVAAWYRHVLSDSRLIRIVTVHDGDLLVGVCPLFVYRDGWGFARYRMAGHQTLVGVQPLTAPGHEASLEHALAERLHQLDPVPDLIELEAVPGAQAWLADAADSWPRRRPRVTGSVSATPVLALHDGGYEAWLDGRRGSGDKQARRFTRRLEEAGYTLRILTEPSEIGTRLHALRRLYLERKAARGGWGAEFGAPMVAMIEDLVGRLAPLGRAVMFTWESDDVVLAADLVLVAGDTLSAWLGAVGTLESRYSPGQLNHVAILDWAYRNQVRLVDWGPGDEQYKQRYATGNHPVETATLVRRNLRPINTPAALVPRGVRTAAGMVRALVARRV